MAKRIAAVTRDQVIKAARSVFGSNQWATGVLLPGSPDQSAAVPADETTGQPG